MACEIFQPEYYSRFQCDGQKCSAKCCRKWTIYIDKKTYKKYSHLKPKSAAQEIIRHLKKREDSDGYFVKLNEKLDCPFLTEDNWCSIQRKYGADFLSEVCTIYPRYILNFGIFYERSLTLTCPIVAEMVLLPEEPLKFEKISCTEKDLKPSNFGKIMNAKLPEGFHDKLISIQETSIFILQERSLTIDQRLMALGLYIDKLDEIFIRNNRLDTIPQINSIYQNSTFLQEQVAQFSAFIKFNSHNHIKIMFGIFDTLYGEKHSQNLDDRKMLDALVETLDIRTDENDQVDIAVLVKKYDSLLAERKEFLQRFSTIFENYLVHEYFLGRYPFKITDTTMTHGYSIFVAIYKILELLTFSASMEKSSTAEELVSQIIWYTSKIDHNEKYRNKIEDYVRNKSDIVEVMQNMLQV